MQGFHDLNKECKILDSLYLVPRHKKKILVIDDLANYKSKSDINHARELANDGIVIALWVYWPILKDSKFCELHNMLIKDHLNIFQILYGEREDLSMRDFEKFTNRKYHNIPNASPTIPINDKLLDVKKINKNSFDIVFIGSKMKSKSFLFKKVIPLLKKNHPSLKIGLYGRGFNKRVRIANGIIKFSNKYINPLSKKLNYFINKIMQRLNQVISDEREEVIYKNSKICINYHEDTPKHIIYNLRYFKIPYYGGFQIVDSPLRKSPYFNQDEVVHINSKDEKIWVDKIYFYLKNPLIRYKIQVNGNQKAIKYHTYKERAKTFLKLYSECN